MNIEDWASIAKAIGGIDANGHESSSSEKAKEAIQALIGEEFLINAVRYYVEGKQGSELLRGVLWQLHPVCAMEECYRIFKTSEDIQTKRDAVELLRVVADRYALKWVSEFLNDDDHGVQVWGIGIVDQLILGELCEPEEVSELLNAADNHANETVRNESNNIRSMISNRDKVDEIVQAYYEQKNE